MQVMTYWFVKPIGKKSNQIIAEALDGDSSRYYDEIILSDEEVVCGVWEVPSYATITDFKRYKDSCGFPFKFQIFKRQGSRGKYYKVPYLSDLKKTKDPQVSAAEEFVQKAQGKKNLSTP